VKTYDIFLFDADNTLFDYDKAEQNALKIMFEKCGFVGYDETIRTRYRKINDEQWSKYERGEISIEELQTSRFLRLFQEIGVWHDPEDFNEKYLHELGKGAFLIDDAEQICEYIISHGKKIYIVTNGLTATQTSRIKYSSIKNYITDFFISAGVGYQKPHIKYFEYVLANIPQIGKDKMLVIGDSLTADIAGGNNAGIDTCWFNPAGSENSTGIVPTYEIRELGEIKGFVE